MAPKSSDPVQYSVVSYEFLWIRIENATVFIWKRTTACSLAVRIGLALRLGLDSVSVWLVVMHTYLYNLPLSSHHWTITFDDALTQYNFVHTNSRNGLYMLYTYVAHRHIRYWHTPNLSPYYILYLNGVEFFSCISCVLSSHNNVLYCTILYCVVLHRAPVMKIRWFASQNATYFLVFANQFDNFAHSGANQVRGNVKVILISVPCQQSDTDTEWILVEHYPDHHVSSSMILTL